MLLPLPMKLGEVWHRQRRWTGRGGPPNKAASSRSSSQSSSNCFGSWQILVDGSEANPATAGDLPQPQAHCKLQSKNFFDLAQRTISWLASDLPFLGEAACLCVVQRRCPVEIILAKPNALPDRPKTFRLHPGITFTFARIPHPSTIFANGAGHSTVFTNHLTRTKANFQFTQVLSLRGILGDNGLLTNQTLFNSDRYKTLTGDILLTYLLHPGTALYLDTITNSRTWQSIR